MRIAFIRQARASGRCRTDEARRPLNDPLADRHLLSQMVTQSRELGINPKMVAKLQRRATVEDMTTGPPEPCSKALSGHKRGACVPC